MRTGITPEKKLHTGRSVWMRMGGQTVPVRPLTASIKADVAIVGAGVSGAFMAEALTRRFGAVVILDRRPPASGATSASTAMLQFEIDEPLTKLSDKIGARQANAAWRRSYRATQELQSLVRAEGLRCGLASRASLYLAGNEMGARALKDEAAARRRIGLPGDFLDAGHLKAQFGIARTGAIFSEGSAIANPVQLAAALLRLAHRRGARVHVPANVTGIMATPHGVVLNAGAHFIEARHAVFCTGYEALKGLPTKGMKITSSWGVASRPGIAYPAWLNRTVVWEASTPYLYLRTTPDGRIVAGGEDEDIDLPRYRARSLHGKARRIASKLKRLHGDLAFTPAYAWSGAFGESGDGLPVIDAVPDMPNCYAVMGFGGNGTIYSRIAADIVPTLIAGRPDKDAGIYRFR
ncbi:MAG: FAD-binding oxidoreductase [Micropepsaceae bacterium]